MASVVKAHVLLVDDDEMVLRSYSRALATHGFRVDVAASGAAAMEALKKDPVDVVVSDISMPDINGLQLLSAIRRQDLDVPVVIMTGDPTLETAVEALAQGALRYLPKPVDMAVLAKVLHDAERLHKVAKAKRQALALLGGEDKLLGDIASLEGTFLRALASLRMAYQPIVSWPTRTVFGYEALMRSGEPLLPHPGAMLDAAERLGRVHDLGRRVRGVVGEALPSLPEGVLLFVNLHTMDLADDELYARDAPLTRAASRVVLEITERASLHAVPDVQVRVERLRRLGFRIAIDDLGAGYAGLTSFALLQPEVVKLDMSLVRDVHLAPTKRTLVRTLTTMCRELGMLVVAEGIETAPERDVLAEAGCELLQGYLFARPEPPFVVPSWG
jgi:EAL domain-containing protein (putative c-di-GMP-specific phosphodiesterase class I)